MKMSEDKKLSYDDALSPEALLEKARDLYFDDKDYDKAIQLLELPEAQADRRRDRRFYIHADTEFIHSSHELGLVHLRRVMRPVYPANHI